ncbi:hypothetical protein D9619_004084 [Psilocybe cf. subviscida]|uniref:Uncharacterized protein n=1 Tax=Psilocybe cf. subviscida TaxID=2480587 RepID=A0A8H5F8M0_9AGAR|nr:hypothetical protein D9619_004084 [Psilocybe cf. subviscida]
MEAQSEIEEHQQEDIMLKETIYCVRFEMETIRDNLDEPPAYTEADKEEREWRMAADMLKKWQQGVRIPLGPVAGGVSEETAEDGKAIKQELGVDCTVISLLIAGSTSSGATVGTSSSANNKVRIARGRIAGDEDSQLRPNGVGMLFHGVGEGFAPDGTAVVWSFLGRVGGSAARMARGWST